MIERTTEHPQRVDGGGIILPSNILLKDHWGIHPLQNLWNIKDRGHEVHITKSLLIAIAKSNLGTKGHQSN
jgi:hypothetical protein